MSHPFLNNHVGFLVGDFLAAQVDVPLPDGDNAGQRVEHRGFSRTVGADQGYYAALFHSQGHSLEGLDRAIVHCHIFKSNNLFSHGYLRYDLPR